MDFSPKTVLQADVENLPIQLQLIGVENLQNSIMRLHDSAFNLMIEQTCDPIKHVCSIQNDPADKLKPRINEVLKVSLI